MPHVPPTLRNEELLGRLFAARSLLSADPTHPVSLPELARSAGLSPFHFLRLFRATFGATPHRLLQQFRLEHAKRLLLETDLPVTEICFECGYESLGSFSALFHRQSGYSPRDYRRLRRRFWPVNIGFLRSFIPFCLLDGPRGWPGK